MAPSYQTYSHVLFHHSAGIGAPEYQSLYPMSMTVFCFGQIYIGNTGTNYPVQDALGSMVRYACESGPAVEGCYQSCIIINGDVVFAFTAVVIPAVPVTEFKLGFFVSALFAFLIVLHVVYHAPVHYKSFHGEAVVAGYEVARVYLRAAKMCMNYAILDSQLLAAGLL